MLRITVEVGCRILTFRLEGRLEEPWLRELEDFCETSRAALRKSVRYLDLTGVTFIDAAGKACLAAMHRQGANSSPQIV